MNSDYSKLADVAEQERFREYDYGPGLGASASATLSLNGRPLLAALYRFAWIDVSNGSIFNKGSIGLSADHYVQAAGLRLIVPVKGSLGLGADGYVFLRQSDYVLTTPRRRRRRGGRTSRSATRSCACTSRSTARASGKRRAAGRRERRRATGSKENSMARTVAAGLVALVDARCARERRDEVHLDLEGARRRARCTCRARRSWRW